MVKQFLKTGRLSSGGFTLLEVMVAVAIISIAFVSLIGAQSQSVSIAGHTRFAVTSALLAQQQLTEIEMAEYDQISSSSGDFGDNYPGYNWQAEVSELGEDETGIEGVEGMLKLIDLTVTLGDNTSFSYVVNSVVMENPKAK